MRLRNQITDRRSGVDGSLPDAARRKPGTYVLVLRADSPARIRVGCRGILNVDRCFYLYVGSAFGPGGVSARVLRHCRKTKALRWHIDYLRSVTTPLEAWCGYGSRELEHRWAQVFSATREVSSVPDFGCSDCKCESHLFWSLVKPDFDRFAAAVGTQLDFWRLDPLAHSAVP